MTTIAYRAGVIAADTKAYGGKYRQSPGFKTKLHRLDDGSIVGISSPIVGVDTLLLRWLRAGCPKLKGDDIRPDEFYMLKVAPAGEVFLAVNGLHFSGPIRSEYCAIGSGEDFALGAMAAGASAADAVRIAALFDAHTGGEVETMTIGGAAHG